MSDGAEAANVQAAEPDVSDVDIDDPRAAAIDALETAVDAINEVSDAGPVEKACGELNAVDDFAVALAYAEANGLSSSERSQYLGTLADEASNLNKTDIRDNVEEKVEAVRGGDPDAPQLNQYLDRAVEHIDIVQTTDAKQSTLYRWKFRNPESGDVFWIETGGNTGQSHYNWVDLRTAIFEVATIWTIRPDDAVVADWPEFIGPFIKERGTEVENKGTRTIATEELQNYVHRTVAYADIEDMREHNGLRLDADPDGGDPEELWIPYSAVSKVCDDYELSPRALQVELDAKGHTIDRIRGVSETTFVNGNKFTYWALSADFAEPAGYETDPEDPVERIES